MVSAVVPTRQFLAHAAMNENPETDGYTVRSASDQRKSRNCLRCGIVFESGWSGERICEKCKKSHEWRAGLSRNQEFVD